VPGTFDMEVKRQGVRLTTHLHLLPMLKMSAAIRPLIIYAFMARKEKTMSLLHFITFSYCFRDNVSTSETLSILRHEVSYSVVATLSKQLTVSLESGNSTH